ncbi:hypothetical protein ES705_29745 [subsurface metagenome]
MEVPNNMDFLLNTIRKIDNDQVKEHSFGNEQSLEENISFENKGISVRNVTFSNIL